MKSVSNPFAPTGETPNTCKQKGFKGSRGQAVKGKENNSNQTTPEFCIPIYPRRDGVGRYTPNTKNQTPAPIKKKPRPFGRGFFLKG